MGSTEELWRHNDDHDCGITIAHKEKEDLNLLLAAKLLSNGYDLTHICGNYPEGSLFIVDTKDKGSLEKDLTKMGIEFNLDCIFIPKGTLIRPFIEKVGDKFYYPATGFGVWAMLLLAKKKPQDLPG